MEKRVFTLLLGIVFLLFGSAAFSQEEDDDENDGTENVVSDDLPKYGLDTLKCKQYLSLYYSFYQQKNYKDAMIGWRYVYNECPKSTKNIYLHGVKMFQDFIKNEKDPKAREALIDTLMMIYNKRIKYFGEEGLVKGRKGNDLFKYRKEKAVDEVYTLVKRSLELRGLKTEPGVLVVLMQVSIIQLQAGKETCDNVISYYAQSSDAIDLQIKKAIEKEKDTENLNKGKSNIDNIFVTSECAKCEAVIPIFRKKFDADKENVDLLKNIVKILNRQGCTDDPLFSDVVEKLAALDPEAVDPLILGYFFKKKGEYSKAAEFFKIAIDTKTEPSEKADAYFSIADVYGNYLGSPSQGRNYAYEAIKLKESWGKPYLLIGLLYANSSSSCGDDAFEQKAVIWAALDKFNKAKAVDPSCASEANNLINKYSQYLPTKEEGFFRGINEGDPWQVKCWINESTTARFKD